MKLANCLNLLGLWQRTSVRQSRIVRSCRVKDIGDIHRTGLTAGFAAGAAKAKEF
jgi:hypothetical protein